MRISLAFAVSIALAAPARASLTAGDSGGDKTVEEWVEEINKDIDQLAGKARSDVVDADNNANQAIAGIGASAGGAGSALAGGASVMDSQEGCESANQNRQQADSAAKPWEGQRTTAENTHNSAKNALNGLKSEVQKIDRKVQSAEKQLGSAESDIRRAGSINPLVRQAQLVAIAGGTSSRVAEVDKDTAEVRKKFDKLKARWDKFKQDLQGGRIAKFDQDTDQYVRKGGSFVQRANQAIGQSQACQAGRSQQAFQTNSQTINRDGSDLNSGRVQSSEAEQAISDVQKKEG